MLTDIRALADHFLIAFPNINCNHHVEHSIKIQGTCRTSVSCSHAAPFCPSLAILHMRDLAEPANAGRRRCWHLLPLFRSVRSCRDVVIAVMG